MIKEIFKTMTIVFTVSLTLGFSFPSWKVLNAKAETLKEDMILLTNNIKVSKSGTETTINNDYDFKTSNYIVKNISNLIVEGKVVLMYSKMSTIDYNDLLIYVNNNVFDLSELLFDTNDNYFMFTIEDTDFSPSSKKEYTINYKVKENTFADKIIGKYFDTNVEVIEY